MIESQQGFASDVLNIFDFALGMKAFFRSGFALDVALGGEPFIASGTSTPANLTNPTGRRRLASTVPGAAVLHVADLLRFEEIEVFLETGWM